ncbi:MAG: SDR family NAD(P)-dependent oxidoreductase [Gammaproteobacteria bacterium]|nr:SDR family NAD(P)-dependent oxidoreductase [Gammaproteobacteria bacterium]
MDQFPSRIPLAIVGYSYRMPGGVRTDDDFWRLLSKRDIVREPIADRYGRGYRPIGGFSGPGRFASPWEGLIREDEEKLFDRGLFGMSQNEMTLTDPQMRMLLTCAWEAFERAGWDLHGLRNSPTGAFIGAQVPAVAGWRPMHGPGPFSVTNTSLAMLANRISYHFNLMGPSITYCTACSASLTALHSAINALVCGDCQQAVVGSVNYLGTSRLSASFNALGVISPDGKCHSFDAEANGYMRAEGAFAFAVKPLGAAERDGDTIYAVVEGTAVNAAGAADGTIGLAQGRYITAPTRHAQAGLMRAACRRANRSPGDFDYIEAHATGTVVGDRIEGNAIAEAFGGFERAAPLRLSSVKSNVGHMEAAAFHCALLKILLMMERRTFAPISRNFLVPNPEIDFESCPMQVQTECEPFPDRPVTVGINSFGFGGANGHCVVREYRPEEPRVWSVPLAPGSGFMIPLSARTSDALTRSARELTGMLGEREVDLYTLAGNLSRRRTHFPIRTAFSVHDREALITALEAFVEDPAPVSTVNEAEPRLLMVFSGQGTQWAGCGHALYLADPVFRRAVDAIEEEWRKHSDFSLRDACFFASQEDLDEVQLAQPVIFMLQCALVEWFKTWGVYPDCVVGHSSGEVAAAYASGALSLADSTRLVFHRARLQQRTAGSGRMLAIGLDRAGVEDLLETFQATAGSGNGLPGQVEIACENAPASTVICGHEAALQPIMEELDRRNRQFSLLPGNIAFHSSAMDPLRHDALTGLSFLDGREFNAEIPFVSSVTGARAERLDADYWWSNIRQTVQFSVAMETIRRDLQPGVVLEVSPHGALQSTVAQCLEGSDPMPACIPALMRNSDVCLGVREALGALFRAGVALDFVSQYPRPEPIAHLLPGHPREDRATMDVMCDDEMFVHQGEYSHGPLVGHKVPCDHILFEARLSDRDFPWMADHRVHHASIMPAAGYIELILEAFEGAPVHIEVLELLQPCPIPKIPVRLQTALHPVPNAPDTYTFSISSRPYDVDAKSELHCQGKVRRTDDHPVEMPMRLEDMDRSRFAPSNVADDSDFYERLDAVLSETFQYGPHFQTIRRVLVDAETRAYLVDIEMDEALWTSGRSEGYVSCPPLFDGGLQIFLFDLLNWADLFAVPRRAEGVTFLKPPSGPRIICHVAKSDEDWFDVNERGQNPVRLGERDGGSIGFYDGDTGELVAYIDKYTYFTSNPRWNDVRDSKHVIDWQPKFIPDGSALAGLLPPGEIGPAELIAALQRPGSGLARSGRALELAGGREPEKTTLKSCLDELGRNDAQTEYWLVSDTPEQAREHYDAFHSHDAALRFEHLDLSDPPALDRGLLRPGAVELLFLHREAGAYGPEEWALAHRLMVAGGLALVEHQEGDIITPGAGWTAVRTARRATLLQAPQSFADTSDAPALPGPRWVLGETDSVASDWADCLDSPETVHCVPGEDLAAGGYPSLDEWPYPADLQAIDFFCGTDPEDPTGERVTTRFIAFVQALVSYRIEHASCKCRLTVVTQRAVHDVENPRGSALWGAVRSMAIEIGEEAGIDFRLVDIGNPGDLETLAWLARCDLRERELAIRKRRLWVPRLVSIRQRHVRIPAGSEPAYRLTLDNAGQVSGLEMKSYGLPEPGPHDVEIEVAAAALNFRDVMVTLRLLPALAYERSALGREIGMEASGVVRRTGPDVSHCGIGDEVVFLQGGCIANRVVAHEHRVFKKPARLSMQEAASSLSVYVTAYYSLIHLARLRRGQRVLIHSALGGVGQAAIALARHAGAEIYATAGSEARRSRLLEMGVRAVFDSHSFDWYDELMATTGEEGVDVVLNSLAGHHIELCLKALRPSGWHCEIGKVDIYADNTLGLRLFRKNLRLAAIDVDRLMLDDPILSRELSQTCLDLIGRGELPAIPVTEFPYRDYARAIRLMTTGQHQGKLVLMPPSGRDDSDFTIADVRPLLDPDATYLVTGGLGGFGLRLLPYLAFTGARHVTLLDRDPNRRRTAEWVRDSSSLVYTNLEIEFDIIQGDVSVEEDVRHCIAQMKRPLKGVFHLAGTLDDRLFDDISPESMSRVFAPKADGALHLHRATSGMALDHFVLFSSTASTLGNPGQVNYSAASAFLDSLAVVRHRQGLPCLAFNLTAVADAGMASRNLHVLRMMRATGTPPVSSDCAIANLDFAMRSMAGRDHLIAAVFRRPVWTVEFSDYMRIGRMLNNQDALEAGAGGEWTMESLVTQIAAKVADLCGHEEGGVEEPLSSFGLTSISVAELGAFIQSQFNYQMSALELMTTASCTSIAHDILHGRQENADDQEEETNGATEASLAIPGGSRRTPSIFANAIEDHFPRRHDGEAAASLAG